ncbi:DapH/DapD/GlmU-related protein [Burkholderia sp. L27(2015)]|uniref:acyltransferase n=1 Tax=Burkholderia sp. L27(2015) TaxID=1641858 RepID=UPI00265CC838|nr:acyltransferase [Burkholderia sp. L27(2015)]
MSRLARELAATKHANAGWNNCTLDTGGTLCEEAEIGNFSGGPEKIRIGKNSYIRGRLQTYGHGGQVTIGDWCYVGVRTEIWSMESITIGNRVLIAHDVNIHDGTAHSTNASERHKHFRDIIERGHPTRKEDIPGIQSAPIVIEDDVWISFGVTILRGVRIGAGSIITAGAIVTRDVPPGAVYRCEISPVISLLDC